MSHTDRPWPHAHRIIQSRDSASILRAHFFGTMLTMNLCNALMVSAESTRTAPEVESNAVHRAAPGAAHPPVRHITDLLRPIPAGPPPPDAHAQVTPMCPAPRLVLVLSRLLLPAAGLSPDLDRLPFDQGLKTELPAAKIR